MEGKPAVLILGGCGFIGRNLVDFLVRNNLVSEIRVADKTPPQMAWLNKNHSESFDNPVVHFCSANLINPASCKNAFTPPKSGKWDLVVNCAAETRPSQSEPVYNEGIYKLSLNCATEAAAVGAKRYVELSSGNVLSSEKTAINETSKIDPWTSVAKFKVKVEKELASVPELNYTIFRLPIVYGPGDKRGLTPRIIIAGLYKYLNETMKLLWNEALKLNTIHVLDVVAAIWELSKNPKAVGEIYNLVDDSESTQGSISDVLAEIFSISIDYWGVVMSNVTKVNMSYVISEINDKHMGPWAEVCQIDGVQNTPLTPYMDEELLFHKHLNLDNSKLKSIGYELRVPKLTAEKIEEVIKDYIEQKLFPHSIFK